MKTTGQLLIRLGVTCLVSCAVCLGHGADAKQAAEAKAEVERPEKEIEGLRELISPTPGSNAVASQVKVCPDGHKTLKNVPIYYGAPSFAPEHRKAREEAVARLEYWPGGCVVESDSPTNRVTCTTCGLGLNSRFGDWSACRQMPLQFSRPFSAAILSLPISATNMLSSGPSYRQTIRTGQKQDEGLSYTTRESKEQVVKRIDAWFGGQGLKPAKHVQSGPQISPTSELVTWESERLKVQLNHLGNEGTTSVYVYTSTQRLFVP